MIFWKGLKKGMSKAKKFDVGKADLSLLPRHAKEGVAKAFQFGADKYGRYNYLKGAEWSRFIAAADRHLTAFNSGETYDPDSGLNHLYHVGANIMILIEYFERCIGEDNRYKGDHYGSNRE